MLQHRIVFGPLDLIESVMDEQYLYIANILSHLKYDMLVEKDLNN